MPEITRPVRDPFMPRVSVFIASYNHAPFVEAAIQSVLDQTYQDFEIVVTDDGSTDGTPDRIAAISDPRIRLHRFPVNRGAVVAANDALRRSRGEYLALLNSDDVFLPHKLQRQVDFLDANPDVGAVFARPSFIDHDSRALGQDEALNGRLFDVDYERQSDWLRHFFFLGNCLCHPTILIRRACFDRIGLYDPRFAALPDFHQWIRLVQAYRIFVLPERLIAFRCLPNGQNASSGRLDNFLRFQWENPIVLKGYAALPDQLFEAVFGPEIASLGLDPRADKRLVLGRICLATQNPTLHRLGLDLLFDVLPPDAEQASGDFRHAQFHREGTGAKDVYNLVAISRVNQLEAELRTTQAALEKATARLQPVALVPQKEGRSLAILDDIFPQVMSAFRFEEYCCYLDQLPTVSIYTTGNAFHFARETRSVTEVIAEFERDNPTHRGRVEPLSPDAFPSAAAYYTIFLNNIAEHVANIEKQGSPFIFTLYPGGGLELGQADSDRKLQRVLGSPCFFRVIVTQPLIRDYLLSKKLCRAEQIVPIFGGVLPRTLFEAPPSKVRFLQGKAHVDLCFVANRYTPQGVDKGYDLFVQTAQLLVAAGVSLRCHVVGPYDASVIPLGEAAAHFEFYGLRPTSFFRDFYAQMDAILSPNRPFVLAPGAFDGFPTACCVEAGLQAVAVLCTNELNQDVGLRDGIDFCAIRPDIDDIIEKLATLLNDPDRLKKMAMSGRERMIELFGPSRQVEPRVRLLRTLAQCEVQTVPDVTLKLA